MGDAVSRVKDAAKFLTDEKDFKKEWDMDVLSLGVGDYAAKLKTGAALVVSREPRANWKKACSDRQFARVHRNRPRGTAERSAIPRR